MMGACLSCLGIRRPWQDVSLTDSRVLDISRFSSSQAKQEDENDPLLDDPFAQYGTFEDEDASEEEDDEETRREREVLDQIATEAAE